MMPTRRVPPTERAAQVTVVAAAVLLELLPLLAWLLIFAAATGPDPLRQLPLPVSWMFVLLCAGWAVGWLGQRPAESRAAQALPRVLLFTGIAVTWLASLILTPAIDGSALLAAPVQSIAGPSGGAAFGLLPLVVYLWWRGLLLGQTRVTRERLYTRLLWGIVAIVIPLMVVNVTIVGARATLNGVYVILLPVDIFVGLVGIALARLLDTVEEHRERRRRAGGEDFSGQLVTRAWLLTALGTSLITVLLALALAAVVSYDTVHALALLLAPVVSAAADVLGWLARGIAWLLFILLDGPVSWLKGTVQPILTPTPGVRPPDQAHTPVPQPLTVPDGFVLAGKIALIALIVAIAAVVLLVAMRHFEQIRREDDFIEVREAVEGGFGLGLREMFARRRRGRERGPAEESLAVGSVRQRYREVLRAARSATLGRADAETPREYAARLSAQLAEASESTTSGEDLATLTAAYDDARYGPAAPNAPDMPAPQPVAGAATRLTHTLHEAARRLTSARDGPGGATHGRRGLWRARR